MLPSELARRLPGPGPDPAWHRARRIYDVFADRGVRYVHEPTASEPGRQAIRTPFEVLAVPGHATCVDLAVTFAVRVSTPACTR